MGSWPNGQFVKVSPEGSPFSWPTSSSYSSHSTKNNTGVTNGDEVTAQMRVVRAVAGWWSSREDGYL